MPQNTTSPQDRAIVRAQEISAEVPVCEELIGIIDDLDTKLTKERDNVTQLTEMLKDAEAEAQDYKARFEAQS